MLDGVHLIERINTRGALIKVLDKPHLDLTTPLGRGFIAFLSAMAEDERGRILKRANDGRTAAPDGKKDQTRLPNIEKAAVAKPEPPKPPGRIAVLVRGKKFGRKPKLTEHQQEEAIKRLAAGESCRAIGRTMGVHHATIARLAG